MPKSAKKKKDKAADFSKAKLKLGKGKQQPTNAIDTSFKARSIALPTQSIAVEKDAGVPTTKRRLTFEDLIAHLKHYNVGTRRDALMGLRELFEAHPHLVEPSLTTLVNACVRIIGDDDASVRKSLLSFLSWLLPQIPPENLIPHSSALLLFTTSAQTHIFPEIRIDAIRFLDLFLDLIPQIVVGGWRGGKAGHGKRVLGGYLGILNAGTKFGDDGDTGPVRATSTASVVLSAASKLVVLRSLAKFLRHAISPQATSAEEYSSTSAKSTTPTWYLSSSFLSEDAFHSFDSLLQPSSSSQKFRDPSAPGTKVWHSECDPETGNEDFVQCFEAADAGAGVDSFWTLQELSEAVTLEDGRRESESDFDIRLARTLHPALMSTFLDCSPAVFSLSASPPDTELSMVQAVTDIYRTMHGSLLQNTDVDTASVHDDVKAILVHMSAYFPFHPSAVIKRNIKVEQAFQDLNLIYCELTALLVLASPSSAPSQSASRRKARQISATSNLNATLSLQLSHVSNYVVHLLSGEPSGSQPNALGRHISTQAYIALIPTIWSLINNPSNVVAAPNGIDEGGDDTRSVLAAVLAHATKCSSTSAVKRPAVELVSRLVLLESHRYYTGIFRLSRYPEGFKQAQAWAEGLPRTLWELGTSNPTLTESILRFFLRVFQRQSPLLTPQLTASLQSRLIPYFLITHPTRGEVAGPFAKWDNMGIRKLALDVVATMTIANPSVSRAAVSEEGTAQKLRDAVRKCVSRTELEEYRVEVFDGVR